MGNFFTSVPNSRVLEMRRNLFCCLRLYTSSQSQHDSVGQDDVSSYSPVLCAQGRI